MKYIFIRITFICYYLTTNFNLLHAQTANIGSPCARILVGLAQDSITWQASLCVGFDSYNLYGGRNGGSLTRLATITDPAQLFFVHSNAGEALWDYYIAMSCNGVEQYQTIQVVNQRPITPDLRSVSIVSNTPVVSWNASPSADVIGYYLYKENPYNSGNYFPYPSANFLINSLQYVDNGTADLLARYAIVAVSPCNKGLLGEGGIDGTTGPHSSMKLTGILDSCSQHIRLDWNAYENWRQGLIKYEIWVATNGGAYVLMDTSLQNNYTYTNAQDLDSLNFYIKAIENANYTNLAISNVYSLKVFANRPMDYIYLTNISVNANNETELLWAWDTDVDYKQSDVLANNISIFSPAPTVINNDFIDINNNAATTVSTYKIKHIDLCNYEVFSNIGQNLLLNGTAENNFTNKLSWPLFNLQYADVQNYEIHRQWGTNQRRMAILSDSTQLYLDNIDINDNTQYSCCYHIVANSILKLPNSRNLNISSRSNTICVYQNAIMYVPNAFIPDGENRFFKPVFVFKNSINNYNMSIFDRYGKIIFETNNYNDSWRGAEYPQGVYTYIIQFTQANGEVVKKLGTVLMIR